MINHVISFRGPESKMPLDPLARERKKKKIINHLGASLTYRSTLHCKSEIDVNNSIYSALMMDCYLLNCFEAEIKHENGEIDYKALYCAFLWL